jgi:hypothetical protein
MSKGSCLFEEQKRILADFKGLVVLVNEN